MANPNPQIGVRMEPDIFERIEREAEDRDRSRAYVAREYMLKGMEEEEKGEPQPA